MHISRVIILLHFCPTSATRREAKKKKVAPCRRHWRWRSSPDHVCGFEDERICGFSQDRSDNFDWTRQNHLTQNPKRSPNTGPETDRSGTKEGRPAACSWFLPLLESCAPTKMCRISFWFSGYYMYTEASRPRIQGDKARLLSPLFNVTSVRGPKGSGRVPYCVSFYYHMKGKHIGK